jgi:RsiW-degrading membrane proteinase PrsW (M82 family)
VPLILLGSYYLRTHRTPTADRVVATVCLGFVVGLVVWAVTTIIYKFIVGEVPQGSLFWVFFFGSYVAGFIMSAHLSKRLAYDSNVEPES